MNSDSDNEDTAGTLAAAAGVLGLIGFVICGLLTNSEGGSWLWWLWWMGVVVGLLLMGALLALSLPSFQLHSLSSPYAKISIRAWDVRHRYHRERKIKSAWVGSLMAFWLASAIVATLQDSARFLMWFPMAVGTGGLIVLFSIIITRIYDRKMHSPYVKELGGQR